MVPGSLASYTHATIVECLLSSIEDAHLHTYNSRHSRQDRGFTSHSRMNEYIHKEPADSVARHARHTYETAISIRKYVHYVVTITISIHWLSWTQFYTVCQLLRGPPIVFKRQLGVCLEFDALHQLFVFVWRILQYNTQICQKVFPAWNSTRFFFTEFHFTTVLYRPQKKWIMRSI